MIAAKLLKRLLFGMTKITTTTTTKNKDTTRDECPACGKYTMYPWDAWANARRCQEVSCDYIVRKVERKGDGG